MNVDAIFALSVKGYEDRQHSFKKRHKGMPFQFIISEKRTGTVEKAVFRAHQNVIRISKQKGFHRVLIFEDDAYPLKEWNEIVNITNESLKEVERVSNGKWKYLVLGYLPIKSKSIGDNINKVECAYDTHAYIVNINNVEYINWDTDIDESTQIDFMLFCNNYSPKDMLTNNVSNNEEVYATKEILYIQKADSSSRTGNIDDHIYYYNVFPNINTAVKISEHMNILHFFAIFLVCVLLILIFLCVYCSKFYNSTKR
jgi:hypothetical protein